MGLIHCRLNRLAHTINWKNPISIFSRLAMRFRYSYRKKAKLFANSEDPDQMPHSVASDLGLHCLPITLLGVYGLQRVKEKKFATATGSDKGMTKIKCRNDWSQSIAKNPRVFFFQADSGLITGCTCPNCLKVYFLTLRHVLCSLNIQNIPICQTYSMPECKYYGNEACMHAGSVNTKA